jgi:Na+-transporting NADH:ubiquinone oxidoreductase subunit NqrB
MNDLVTHIQQALSQIAAITIVVALSVLWLRRRSGWVLLALIGELGVLACNLAFTLSPSTFASLPAMRVLWSLNACIFAFGMLGYAWSETTVRAPAATGVQP